MSRLAMRLTPRRRLLTVRSNGTPMLSAAELGTLAARSTPAINKYRVSAKGNAIELDAIPDMLEVRLIRIKPHFAGDS